MKIPNLDELKSDLRNALVINAEGLFLLAGGDLGGRLAAEYLGVDDIQDLPTDLFSDSSRLQTIDVSRHHIWVCIKRLHYILESQMFAENSGTIDVEMLREDYLVFLELFLASIPNIALGGWDGTAVHKGHLLTLFKMASAWLRLGSDIDSALNGEWGVRELQVTDLAIIAGINETSIRNQVGKNKPIRSDDIQGKAQRGLLEGRAFVSPNLIDSLDWLKRRNKFKIAPLANDFIANCVKAAPQKSDKLRGFLVAWMINNGTIKDLAKQESVSVEDLRKVGDGNANANGISAIKSAWKSP